MARKLRIQYPGAIYHVMNRGDRQEPIFQDDDDRERFLETLGEACAKTGWQVLGYCLMANHFHLVVETPIPKSIIRFHNRSPSMRTILLSMRAEYSTASLEKSEVVIKMPFLARNPCKAPANF